MVKRAKLGKSATGKVEKPRNTVKAVSVSSKIKRAEGSSKNLSVQLQECVEKKSRKLGSTTSSSLAVKSSLTKSPSKSSQRKSPSVNRRASSRIADDLKAVVPSTRRCSTRVSTFKRTASYRDDSVESMPPRKKVARVVTKRVSPKKVNDSIQKKKSVPKKQNTRKINNNKKSNNNNSMKIGNKSSENNSQEKTLSQTSDKMMPFIKLQDIKHLTPERQHNLSTTGNIETTSSKIIEEENAVELGTMDNCEGKTGNIGSTCQNVSMEDNPSKSKSCGQNEDKSSTNKSSVQSTSAPDKEHHPLFTRKFISVNNTDDGSCDATASQEVGENAAVDRAHEKFTVATYNILADCHAQRDYSGSNSWVSKEELSMEKRHVHLMDEIKWLDADVFCFQEVGTSYFSDLLKPSMAGLGYEGLYVARISQEYREGEATFFKTSKFKLKSSKNLLLGDLIMDEIGSLKDEQTKKLLKDSVDTYAVSLLLRLEELSSGLHLSVANVHIAFDWFKRQDKQCLQIATTIKELQKLSGNDLDAQVMCGDFNSWPDSPPQLMIRNGILSEESIKLLQNIMSVEIDGEKTPLFNHVPELFDINTAPDYKSAYQVVMGLEPHTSRFDPDNTVNQVDYIYYSGSSLVAKKVLSVPDKSLIQHGVPNSVFPSDHLSLMAEFSVV